MQKAQEAQRGAHPAPCAVCDLQRAVSLMMLRTGRGESLGQVFFSGHFLLARGQNANSDVTVTSHCLIFTVSLPATNNCRPNVLMAKLGGVDRGRS